MSENLLSKMLVPIKVTELPNRIPSVTGFNLKVVPLPKSENELSDAKTTCFEFFESETTGRTANINVNKMIFFDTVNLFFINQKLSLTTKKN